jgi:phenylalanyl-tRNA synthetase beta chain
LHWIYFLSILIIYIIETISLTSGKGNSMKISLRWIFDHLKADVADYSVEALIEQFNATTAEIEGFEKVELNLNDFALSRVLEVFDDRIVVDSKEWGKNFEMSYRTDVKEGLFYLIKKNKDVDPHASLGMTSGGMVWASMLDLHCDKEGLLPAFYCTQEDLSGGWKKSVEATDYILEVDNKSVTNRPDLWGHYGFAREFSAILKVELLSESNVLADVELEKVATKFKATENQPFSIINSAPDICKRFSALYVSEVERRDSVLWMAIRLLRIDTRSIDFLVDATNYTMFQTGQPIHAFDADFIESKTIEPRFAKEGENLTLLDETELKLTKEDLVITDGKKPIALAGIKGGLRSGVTPQTTSLLIESANFDATTVRLSAARHKTRTDASARFEKTLDPNQNVKGVQCFIKLLQNEGVKCIHAPKIISVGDNTEPLTITIEHSFITKRLGVELKKDFIISALTSLGMEVTELNEVYSVIVPTFRSTKDITIKEDIVEEVARLYGYKNIPLNLPKFTSVAVLQPHIDRMFLIKNFLAFGAGMNEVENYAVANNDFLKKINWKLKNGLHLANPLSVERETMIDSLIPHLLSNVTDNMANNDELSFFEVGSLWQVNNKKIEEEKVIAGVFYHKKEIDFYEVKAKLQRLFDALMVSVTWRKAKSPAQWASRYQTADLFINEKLIGQCGIVTKRITARLGGDMVAFECDINALCYAQEETKCFKQLPKYQATKFDISMMVQTAETVADISEAIASADKRIYNVSLRDIFKKPDWKDKKSVTMRFVVRDENQPLSKDDLDGVYKAVEKAIAKKGAEIR